MHIAVVSLLVVLALFVLTRLRRGGRMFSAFGVDDPSNVLTVAYDPKFDFYDVVMPPSKSVVSVTLPTTATMFWTVFTDKSLALDSDPPIRVGADGKLVKEFKLKLNQPADGEFFLRSVDGTKVAWKQYRVTFGSSAPTTTLKPLSSLTTTLRPPTTTTSKPTVTTTRVTPAPTTTRTTTVAPRPTIATGTASAGGWMCAKMPQSWASEELFVRMNGTNMECEANDPNTGCNYRENGACQRMLAQGFKPSRGYPVSANTIKNQDWAMISHLTLNGGRCEPYCPLPSMAELLSH